MQVSKPELSAFFRSPDKSQYRLCKDQFLRNFLYGMQEKIPHYGQVGFGEQFNKFGKIL